MKPTLTLLLLTISATLFSQLPNTAVLENDLVQRMHKMQQFSGNYDSAGVYSDEFTDSMNTYITRNKQTLNYDFAKLKAAGVSVTTSGNGNFRIYSWDTNTGGTMHFFRTIYQYKTATAVYTKIIEPGEGDAGCFCSQIFTLTAPAGIYYLAINNAVYSGKDAAQWVQAYTIQSDSLNDAVKLFKADDTLSNSIILQFDFFSVADHRERPLKLIDYNPATQTLSVPETIGYGQVIKSNKRYRFNGTYFK